MNATRAGKVYKDLTIERGRGATYSNNKFTVYAHDVYGRGSVLQGQPMRIYIESFDSIEDAQKCYPHAVVIAGTTYREPDLSHLPDDGDY